MSSRVRSLLVAAAVLTVLVSHSSTVCAAEWHPPVEGGSVLLGFGAGYPGGTHRGVDIAAASGDGIAAPGAGTVSFAGRVPADGGGTCTAVTLEFADGRKMSLLPLESAEVVTGECVEVGQTLGRLAASGDDSSAATHLHVSLRSGDLYLDPGDLVSGAVAVAAEPPVAPACPPVDISGGVGGGTPAPCPHPATAVPADACVAPSSPVQISGSAASTAAGPTAATPRVAQRVEIESSGVPETSALMPASWQPTARDVPVFVRFDSRAMTGTMLACAMLLAAGGIVLSRRAHPVRVN